MGSVDLVVWLVIGFSFIGVGSSVVYYFARYYVKTDDKDKELLTQKPLDFTPSATTTSKSQTLTTTVTPPKDLSSALSKTKDSLWGRLSKLTFKSQFDSELREQIEEILYTSDLGPKTAEALLTAVSEKLTRSEVKEAEQVRASLRDEMQSVFSLVQSTGSLFDKIVTAKKPVVWMIVGVNGVGKTTTIGKLASLANARNLKTMIVAGDTFRAAADSQLKVWAERAGCEFFSPENVKDPNAVAYAGYEKAKQLNMDLVLVDTAGRLHTQDHLMEEIKKMKRVLGKIDSSSPHERVLVIDANAGQNALIQATQFHQATDLTGVIITKMDGSSKAGVAVGIANDLKIPILYVGIGESIEDLRPFDAQKFIEAIV